MGTVPAKLLAMMRQDQFVGLSKAAGLLHGKRDTDRILLRVVFMADSAEDVLAILNKAEQFKEADMVWKPVFVIDASDCPRGTIILTSVLDMMALLMFWSHNANFR